MCDDTFVYHKGTASFDTEEKKKLLEEHEAILNDRYAAQMRMNHLYCMENPDQEIRDNINMYTKLHNGKQNILYLLHLDFQEGAFNNIGGTQIHVKELTMALRDEYNVFVAARDEEYLRLTIYTDKDVVSLKFEIGEAPKFPVFRDEKMRKIYEQILLAFDIDMVHIQHSQDLSLELYFAAERFGIPVIATIHDFYYARRSFFWITKISSVRKRTQSFPLKRGRNAAGNVCVRKKTLQARLIIFASGEGKIKRHFPFAGN